MARSRSTLAPNRNFGVVRALEIVAGMLAAISFVCLALAASELMFRHLDARDARRRHPAGSRCPNCQRDIEDWDSHQRLFHQARVAAPEDMW